MNTVLMFWNDGPGVVLSPPEIYRELTWGEEVAGLIDLPVKGNLGRLKSAFASHDEESGLLTIRTDNGSCEATWTWQYIRVECRNLDDDDRQRIVEAIGLPAYDAGLELRD